jgi:hypothetical protein
MTRHLARLRPALAWLFRPLSADDAATLSVVLAYPFARRAAL